MGQAAVAVASIPDSVKDLTLEVRDELNWLNSEFSDLVQTEDLAEFGTVLDGVMDYVEDLHSALEKLEQVVAKVS